MRNHRVSLYYGTSEDGAVLKALNLLAKKEERSISEVARRLLTGALKEAIRKEFGDRKAKVLGLK